MAGAAARRKSAITSRAFANRLLIMRCGPYGSSSSNSVFNALIRVHREAVQDATNRKRTSDSVRVGRGRVVYNEHRRHRGAGFPGERRATLPRVACVAQPAHLAGPHLHRGLVGRLGGEGLSRTGAMASGSSPRRRRLTNRLVGMRVEVIGLDKLDPDQAYVFTPNHRSHVDITALMAALPAVRFAAKRELFDEPVLGTAMRALGMIPIDRDDPALAKRTLDEAAAKLGKTVSVVIFPEGTRAPAGQMLPLKGGAFVFAIEQQVPVVPVALHNTAQVMPAHGYLTILGGRVVVEILDPIPTAGLAFEDRHQLKEQVRAGVGPGAPPGGRRSRRSTRPGLLCRPRVRRARADDAPRASDASSSPRVLIARRGRRRRVHEAERHRDRCWIVGNDPRIHVCAARADHDLGARRRGRRGDQRAPFQQPLPEGVRAPGRAPRNAVDGGGDARGRGRRDGRAVALLSGGARAGRAVRAALGCPS